MRKILIFIYLAYLRFFTKLQLRKVNPVIIGVGGASGKSSTALLISKILSKKFIVKQGKGRNSETGIPLTILGIDIENYSFLDWLKVFVLAPVRVFTNFEKYDFFVVEMGIDSPHPPKNMEYLLKIVQPNIGILTNINIEHSLYFDSLTTDNDLNVRKKEILDFTAKQEGLLLKSIPESGRSFVNIDDPLIFDLLPLKSKTVTISAKDKNADFYISNVEVDESSFVVQFDFLNEKHQISISNPLPFYFAYSLVFGIAVSFSCGFSIKDAIKTLEENFHLPPGRFSVFKGIKNTTLIDSSYNSSLEPAKGALEMLSKIGANKRKVGILGDMRELGSLSKIQHEELAKTILKTLDFAILIGPEMIAFVSPILKKEKFDFVSFETFSKAKHALLKYIKNKDLILIKGSQNSLFLERAVELLLADRADVDRLTRRGKFWDSVRRKTP